MDGWGDPLGDWSSQCQPGTTGAPAAACEEGKAGAWDGWGHPTSDQHSQGQAGTTGQPGQPGTLASLVHQGCSEGGSEEMRAWKGPMAEQGPAQGDGYGGGEGLEHKGPGSAETVEVDGWGEPIITQRPGEGQSGGTDPSPTQGKAEGRDGCGTPAEDWVQDSAVHSCVAGPREDLDKSVTEGGSESFGTTLREVDRANTSYTDISMQRRVPAQKRDSDRKHCSVLSYSDSDSWSEATSDSACESEDNGDGLGQLKFSPSVLVFLETIRLLPGVDVLQRGRHWRCPVCQRSAMHSASVSAKGGRGYGREIGKKYRGKLGTGGGTGCALADDIFSGSRRREAKWWSDLSALLQHAATVCTRGMQVRRHREFAEEVSLLLEARGLKQALDAPNALWRKPIPQSAHSWAAPAWANPTESWNPPPHHPPPHTPTVVGAQQGQTVIGGQWKSSLNEEERGLGVTAGEQVSSVHGYQEELRVEGAQGGAMAVESDRSRKLEAALDWWGLAVGWMETSGAQGVSDVAAGVPRTAVPTPSFAAASDAHRDGGPGTPEAQRHGAAETRRALDAVPDSWEEEAEGNQGTPQAVDEGVAEGAKDAIQAEYDEKAEGAPETPQALDEGGAVGAQGTPQAVGKEVIGGPQSTSLALGAEGGAERAPSTPRVMAKGVAEWTPATPQAVERPQASRNASSTRAELLAQVPFPMETKASSEGGDQTGESAVEPPQSVSSGVPERNQGSGGATSAGAREDAQVLLVGERSQTASRARPDCHSRERCLAGSSGTTCSGACGSAVGLEEERRQGPNFSLEAQIDAQIQVLKEYKARAALRRDQGADTLASLSSKLQGLLSAAVSRHCTEERDPDAGLDEGCTGDSGQEKWQGGGKCKQVIPKDTFSTIQYCAASAEEHDANGANDGNAQEVSALEAVARAAADCRDEFLREKMRLEGEESKRRGELLQAERRLQVEFNEYHAVLFQRIQGQVALF